MSGTSFTRFGICSLWFLAIGVGIAMTLHYENAGGTTGITPDHWPTGVPVALDKKRDTLIMFAHPQCPCTRASTEELNRLLTHCNGQVAAHVLFLKPADLSDAWVHTSLWRAASDIPTVSVHEDPGGLIAQKFGAETSGFVVLYSPDGRLLFKGGITASRGHAGDNLGEEAITTLARGESLKIPPTQVYGCSLLDKSCSPQP